MQSIAVANTFISRYGNDIRITNLSLNKLVYFAQVESLKATGKPLFEDSIEAWEYGPVEPAVYHKFKKYGRSAIKTSCEDFAYTDKPHSYVVKIVDEVAKKYGSLTAFDLVSIAHRDGGAWRNKYVSEQNVVITIEDIKNSKDFLTDIDLNKTLAASISDVKNKWPNALRMLEDA